MRQGNIAFSTKYEYNYNILKCVFCEPSMFFLIGYRSDGMNFEQLSMFREPTQEVKEEKKAKSKAPDISARITDEFEIVQVPFLECNYEKIYPLLNELVPKEDILFNEWGLEYIIACETVCAAICHQMNWDYLRAAVYDKTRKNKGWLSANSLKCITEVEIQEMFKGYKKPERIRASERTKILQDLGDLISNSGGFTSLFINMDDQLLSYETICANILSCGVFSQDPGQKKFRLLLQKLSNYPQLNGLANYCEPAVDYHLLRCFLRRGLIYPKTKFASDFILAPETERKESTVGALRQLSADLIRGICEYTTLDVNAVNVIEWNVGRSICVQENPDCMLNSDDAAWARKDFQKCPFFDTCTAAKHKNEYLKLVEPTYKGTSY